MAFNVYNVRHWSEVMSNALVIVFLLTLVGAGCRRAPDSSSFPAPRHTGERRVETYIPRDLDECFVELNDLLGPEEIESIRTGTEDGMIMYHFGLGMWMRNNWGLWSDSRLAKWFNAIGIYHADDMSGIILDSFWRHLNNRPIKLDEQVEGYREFWKRQSDNQQTQ